MHRAPVHLDPWKGTKRSVGLEKSSRFQGPWWEVVSLMTRAHSVSLGPGYKPQPLEPQPHWAVHRDLRIIRGPRACVCKESGGISRAGCGLREKGRCWMDTNKSIVVHMLEGGVSALIYSVTEWGSACWGWWREGRTCVNMCVCDCVCEQGSEGSLLVASGALAILCLCAAQTIAASHHFYHEKSAHKQTVEISSMCEIQHAGKY